MADIVQDTRRCIVQRLVDAGVTEFAMRPATGTEEQRQEVIVMSGLEALHALPCCDADIVKPTAEVEMVTTADLNVRSVASATGNIPVGLLPTGTHVFVAVDTNAWKTITRGAFAGKFTSGAYLKVPNP